MTVLASGVLNTPGCYVWKGIFSCHLMFLQNKAGNVFPEFHKPVEREPWDRGFCCIVVLPTKYGLPQVAGSDQLGGLVSVLYIFWTPFRCPERNFVEAAGTSHQCQGWGCPV